MATPVLPETKTMLTLPGDAVRQIQWRLPTALTCKCSSSRRAAWLAEPWPASWPPASATPTSGPPPKRDARSL